MDRGLIRDHLRIDPFPHLPASPHFAGSDFHLSVQFVFEVIAGTVGIGWRGSVFTFGLVLLSRPSSTVVHSIYLNAVTCLPPIVRSGRAGRIPMRCPVPARVRPDHTRKAPASLDRGYRRWRVPAKKAESSGPVAPLVEQGPAWTVFAKRAPVAPDQAGRARSSGAAPLVAPVKGTRVSCSELDFVQKTFAFRSKKFRLWRFTPMLAQWAKCSLRSSQHLVIALGRTTTLSEFCHMNQWAKAGRSVYLLLRLQRGMNG